MHRAGTISVPDTHSGLGQMSITMGLSSVSAFSFECVMAADPTTQSQKLSVSSPMGPPGSPLLNSPLVCGLNKHFLSSCTLPGLKSQQKES